MITWLGGVGSGAGSAGDPVRCTKMIVRIAATLTKISISAVRRVFAATAGAVLPAATGRGSKSASNVSTKMSSKVSWRCAR